MHELRKWSVHARYDPARRGNRDESARKGLPDFPCKPVGLVEYAELG
jgi:hypothetical protein